MEYVFGFAGIDADVYDRLYVKLLAQGSKNITLIGSPLGQNVQAYTNRDTHLLRKKFTKHLAADSKIAEPTKKAYCLICVELDPQSTLGLVQEFFPELLVITIPWVLDGKTKTEKNRQINKLIRDVREVMKRAKTTLRAVQKELNERSNRTPLLLPVKNFKSSIFNTELFQLSRDLAKAAAAEQAVRMFSKRINQSHPPQIDGTSGRKGRERYIDDRGIHFVPPGKHRHAFLRSSEGHPEKCLLTSHLRLGAPYHPAFHYDCTKGLKNLKGNFFGCHTDERRHEGAPHLNIATNDFVRQ